MIFLVVASYNQQYDSKVPKVLLHDYSGILSEKVEKNVDNCLLLSTCTW